MAKPPRRTRAAANPSHSDAARTAALRGEALKYLVHFVGDMHQPLHCADNTDRGGNDVEVFFHRRRSNLHAVWDEGIVSESKLGEREYARALLKGLTPIPYKIVTITSGFAGYNFWLTKLNQFNGDYISAEMVKAFISFFELNNRF